MVSVAFLDVAVPCRFSAEQVYVPLSVSFLPVLVDRKKREPDGNRTRWDRGSSADVVTVCPSLCVCVERRGS